MSQKAFIISPDAWEHFQTAMAARPDSIRTLRKAADRWLVEEPPDITAKRHPAPSGDPHDYHSVGPYWWPHSGTPSGLPWIARDGEVNPVFYEYDNQKLETVCLAVNQLILQARLIESSVHASRAGDYLRTWFLAPESRMNPHLRYAQAVPGQSEGSAAGLIDTTSLIFLLDMVTHLPFNDRWTTDDLDGLRAWISQYLDWMLESDLGRQEGNATNNHGSWYDAQVCTYAIFCGRPEIARAQIESRAKSRLSLQLAPDGSQPHELTRTLSLTYCTYNLLAFCCTAQIASPLGIDLWNWEDTKGSFLKQALNWMLPYYLKEQEWPGKQIKPFNFSSAALLLQIAWQGTGDSALNTRADTVSEHPWQRLVFSKAALAARNEAKGS